MKGQINLGTLIGYFIVLLVYIVGFYPVMRTIITDAMPSMDPISASLISFVPAGMFIAIFIGIFQYAFGKKEQFAQ